MDKDTVSKIINSDEILVKNFIAEITDKVNAKIEARESKRHRNFSLIFGAIALIGTAGIYSMITVNINQAVSEAIAKEKLNIKAIVNDEVEKKISEVNNQLILDKLTQNLAYLAFSLDFKDSFTNSERDLIIDILRDYKKNKGKVNDEFLAYLEKIVDSFSSAHLNAYIDDIYNLYGSEMLNKKGIAITLIEHYGRRYLVALYDNDQDKLNALKPIYEDLLRSAERFKYPELAIWLELGESKYISSTDVNDHVKKLFNRAKLLSDNDKTLLVSQLFKYRKSSYWQKHEQYDGLALSEIYNPFFSNHEQQIAGLMSNRNIIRRLIEKALGYSDPLRNDLLEWIKTLK